MTTCCIFHEASSHGAGRASGSRKKMTSTFTLECKYNRIDALSDVTVVTAYQMSIPQAGWRLLFQQLAHLPCGVEWELNKIPSESSATGRICP